MKNCQSHWLWWEIYQALPASDLQIAGSRGWNNWVAHLKSMQAHATHLMYPDYTKKNHASGAKTICLHAAELLLQGPVCQAVYAQFSRVSFHFPDLMSSQKGFRTIGSQPQSLTAILILFTSGLELVAHIK